MTSSHPLSKNNLCMLFPALVALGALAAAELTPAERSPATASRAGACAQPVREPSRCPPARPRPRTAGASRARRRANLHVERNDSLGEQMWRWLTHPEILRRASASTSTPRAELRIMAATLFVKYPGDPATGSVGWHQDLLYWDLEPAEAFATWLAIDAVDEPSGCVRFAPGSHMLGPLEHVYEGPAADNLLMSKKAIPEALLRARQRRRAPAEPRRRDDDGDDDGDARDDARDTSASSWRPARCRSTTAGPRTAVGRTDFAAAPGRAAVLSPLSLGMKLRPSPPAQARRELDRRLGDLLPSQEGYGTSLIPEFRAGGPLTPSRRPCCRPRNPEAFRAPAP